VRETTRSWQIKVERHKKDWEIRVYVKNIVWNNGMVKAKFDCAKVGRRLKHKLIKLSASYSKHSSTVFLAVEGTFSNVILTDLTIPQRYRSRNQT